MGRSKTDASRIHAGSASDGEASDASTPGHTTGGTTRSPGGRELEIALLGRAAAGADAHEYRRAPVEGVRARVHGHERVSEPQWTPGTG